MNHTPSHSAGSRIALREQAEHTPKRFYGRTALGMVLPGSGLILRNKRSGWVLIGITWGGAIAIIALALTRGFSRSALWLAVRPNAVLVLMVALVSWAVVLALSIVYTGWLHRPQPRNAGQTAAALAWVGLLCAALLAPVIIGAADLTAHRQLLVSAFGTGTSRAAGAADPDASRSNPWERIPRVNLLFLGSDGAADRVGVRTDSIMVISIDTSSGAAVLFGLPRNLESVPFPANNPLHALYPDGYQCPSECLLNAVWEEAERHADLFDSDSSPGLTTTRGVVSQILGLTMDATVVVDMRGFADLVDAVGGVDMTVRERIPTGGKVEGGQIVPGSITGWIDSGEQHLDGYHAMWFARSRATTDDFSRMRRQRCLAGALIAQVDAQTLLTRYPQIAQATRQNLSVDIPLEDLSAWVDLLAQVQRAGAIRSLPFSDLNTNTGDPDFARIRALVQESLNPAASTSAPTTPTTTASATTAPGPTGEAGRVTVPAPSAPESGTGPDATEQTTDAPTTQSLVDLSDAC